MSKPHVLEDMSCSSESQRVLIGLCNGLQNQLAYQSVTMQQLEVVRMQQWIMADI